MPSHQRQQPAIPRSGRIHLLPEGKKMLVDQTDDMETVRHDHQTP
jgi:hypothetical protein